MRIYIYDGFFSIVTSLVSRTLHVARARALSGLLAVFPIPSIHRAQQCPVKVSSGPTLKIRDPAPRCAMNYASCICHRVTGTVTFYLLSLINNVPGYYHGLLSRNTSFRYPSEHEFLLCSTSPFVSHFDSHFDSSSKLSVIERGEVVLFDPNSEVKFNG